MLVLHMEKNTCLTLSTTTLAWPGSIHSRRSLMLLVFSMNGRLWLRMRQSKMSSYFVQTMEVNTHLDPLHNTCAMRAYTTRPLHHTHQLRTANLNVYTGL